MGPVWEQVACGTRGPHAPPLDPRVPSDAGGLQAGEPGSRGSVTHEVESGNALLELLQA